MICASPLSRFANLPLASSPKRDPHAGSQEICSNLGIDLSYDGEIPGRERGVGRRAGREHREAALQILDWRDASALVARLLAAAKPARDESFTHVLTSCSCVALLLLFTILLYADVQSSLLQS